MIDNLESKGGVEKMIFIGSTQINSLDGWLSPGGVYWKCRSDQHESCARHIANRVLRTQKATISDGILARTALADSRYVQINAGTVLPADGTPLTDKQLEKIDQANKQRKLGLKIAISTTSPDWESYQGMAMSYKLGLFDLETQNLLQHYFSEAQFIRFDDNPEKARKLFDALTLGLPEEDYHQSVSSYRRTFRYRLPRDHSYAVELVEHFHDGGNGQGLTVSNWVRVIDGAEYQQMFLEQNDPYEEYDFLTEDITEPTPTTPIEKSPVNRIHGLPARQRSNSLLN